MVGRWHQGKWLDRVERYVLSAFESYPTTDKFGADEQQLNVVRNNTIKSVDGDYEAFSFNTAVARMMELVNAMAKYDQVESKNAKFYQDSALDLLKMLAPLAPHFAEELWHQVGQEGSIVRQTFPTYDENALKLNTVEILVQINSRPKLRLNVDSSLDRAGLEQVVLGESQVVALLEGKPIKKAIVVPGKLVNLII